MAGTESELIVASVALLVSVIALSATFTQVLQQYYASASGYSQCNEEVMGPWARHKKRRFSWEELRFEVQFEVPVIFVAKPSNTRGPMGPDIILLQGTPDSREQTGTPSDTDLPKDSVHTADNERASWLGAALRRP